MWRLCLSKMSSCGRCEVVKSSLSKCASSRFTWRSDISGRRTIHNRYGIFPFSLDNAPTPLLRSSQEFWFVADGKTQFINVVEVTFRYQTLAIFIELCDLRQVHYLNPKRAAWMLLHHAKLRSLCCLLVSLFRPFLFCH